jgi:protein Tex
MEINRIIADELSIKLTQADAAIKLIDEGNTIPFIARYRKEATGSLNDEVLRNLYERLTYLRGLSERQDAIIKSIDEQGKLTDELKAKILAAKTMVEVEDLYLPYKQKRRTRAMIAAEKGLKPLADIIFSESADKPVLELAAEYVNEELKVATPQEAIDGAKDIIAEMISDNADYRKYIREITAAEGTISSAAKDEKAVSVYEMYYKFEERINKILGHRVLALNRGEDEKVLTVKINAPADKIMDYLNRLIVRKVDNNTDTYLLEAVRDSYDRLIAPAIEREIRNDLTEKAQDGAIKVFGKNLAQLLMQPPIEGQVVLGWDPAFRTGCKLAVVDATGKVLDTVVVYPTAPTNEAKIAQAKKTVEALIDKYGITLISVGNGTASRESEQVIVDMLKEINKPVKYVIVNEAGASVYSASKLATEEFPKFDVGQRSAASIARRLQDPLSELVKIDPQSIGVGQYQHDMDKKKLSEALNGVVEDCVNKVGVDLNTASASLLEYVSGVSKPIAKNIVSYREENGKFVNRRQLLKVAKLGPKAFEQCAGFLRINDGDEVLDATSVHPESYEAAKKLLEKLGYTKEDVKNQIAARRAERKAGKLSKSVTGIKIKTDIKTLNNHSDGNTGIKPNGFKTGSAMAKLLLNALGNDAKAVDGNLNKSRDNRKADTYTASPASENGLLSISGRIADKCRLADELGIGEITLNDIVSELEKPCRDPRDEMPKPILRTDVMDIKDLKEGMILKGTVRNVIDFGVFVDIGVHQDGLVHISQMSRDRYVKHPLDVVSVGDIVDVRVLSVDQAKNRIQLSMIM